jgi:hypothetical protein
MLRKSGLSWVSNMYGESVQSLADKARSSEVVSILALQESVRRYFKENDVK